MTSLLIWNEIAAPLLRNAKYYHNDVCYAWLSKRNQHLHFNPSMDANWWLCWHSKRHIGDAWNTQHWKYDKIKNNICCVYILRIWLWILCAFLVFYSKYIHGYVDQTSTQIDNKQNRNYLFKYIKKKRKFNILSLCAYVYNIYLYDGMRTLYFIFIK